MKPFDADRAIVCIVSLMSSAPDAARDVANWMEAAGARVKWVPQTLADSIWVLGEFPTVQARDEFRQSIIPPLDGLGQTQEFFDHWTGSRYDQVGKHRWIQLPLTPAPQP